MNPAPAQAADGRTRLLIVTDEMEVGGTQRQIVHLARNLDRRRFEATVVYFCNPSFLVDDLRQAGVNVVEIPKRSRLDPGFVRRLRAFIDDGGFDIVHCFSFTGELWGAVACRLLPRRRRPVLITSVRNKYDWFGALHWRLKGWASRQSRRVIANSRAGADYAQARMGLPASALQVIYNGVADAPAAALQAVPASKTGQPVTLQFVGRLVEQKNVPVLLRAVHRLRQSGTALRLRVAGDGPLRPEIERQIAELGIGEVVEMLGERSDASLLMGQADVVVLPSLREGLSNVILEAMIVGRPVVASAVGGSVELVEPMQTGLLFPSNDDAALAAALGQLIADAPLRERLGAQARRRALERFTVEAMVRTTERAYLACLPGTGEE